MAGASGQQRKMEPVTPAERLRWALAAWRSAQFRARLHKGDRALALAADARRNEYLDMRFRIEGK